jgi:uncharacterized protein (DUF433 family)
MDWKDCDAVESRPDKLSGTWVFRGTRVPVEALFENLLGGATLRDFTEWFQGVELDQVEEVIRHQIQTLKEESPDEDPV